MNYLINLIYKWLRDPVAEEILRQLADPKVPWTFTKFCAVHKDYQIWIANGVSFIALYYPHGKFGWIYRYKIYQAVKERMAFNMRQAVAA